MPPARRLYLDKQSSAIFKSLTAVAVQVRAQATELGLSRRLLELVNIRVSQLNGCGYCLQLHTARALAEGETTHRLSVLTVWRETELFEPRERAALMLAEGATLVAGERITDAEYAWVTSVLTADEISVLSWAAITINSFNRVSILSRHPVPVQGPAVAADAG
ncbi:carboxymuconolactone decarboxylase family protein [Micromonospora sp. NBC_01699]|uniref:carboxymuconolactone decarboxylase family protein n=1 Tax=Micromonospora sp. NBC_01699 TaxID=2975984 RepID=UPI002E3398AA|nr:carboxymuconolactone decarboxylase family protein [Micromonospora sp. NBC_01699]